MDNFKRRLYILVKKIIKYSLNINNLKELEKEKLIKIGSKIETIIIKTDKTRYIKSMLQINKLLLKNSIKKNIIINNIDTDKHKYIAFELVKIIKELKFNNKIKIADIGGGEGYIIEEIGKLMNINKENLYCIEQKEWHELYTFNNNIKYIFWNNENIDIPNNTIDIIIIMVTLHHMHDNIIENVFINIKKILKPNGIIIIKEHDYNYKIKTIIDWEHHLYHIIASPNNNINKNDLEKYFNYYVNNYKSKLEFDTLFKKYNFIDIIELDTHFNKSNNKFYLNPTNLYWKIYTYK